MINCKHLQDEMNESFARHKKHIKVSIKKYYHTPKPPQFLIRHFFKVDEKTAEYRTLIDISHYERLGHNRFMVTLYRLLLKRMDDNTANEFNKKLKDVTIH